MSFLLLHERPLVFPDKQGRDPLAGACRCQLQGFVDMNIVLGDCVAWVSRPMHEARPHPGSCELDRLRASKLEHAVQRVHGDGHLGGTAPNQTIRLPR